MIKPRVKCHQDGRIYNAYKNFLGVEGLTLVTPLNQQAKDREKLRETQRTALTR